MPLRSPILPKFPGIVKISGVTTSYFGHKKALKLKKRDVIPTRRHASNRQSHFTTEET